MTSLTKHTFYVGDVVAFKAGLEYMSGVVQGVVPDANDNPMLYYVKFPDRDVPDVLAEDAIHLVQHGSSAPRQ